MNMIHNLYFIIRDGKQLFSTVSFIIRIDLKVILKGLGRYTYTNISFYLFCWATCK